MIADVDSLRHGYEKAGQWDLGMVLDHLTKGMSGPFTGGGWNLPWPVGATLRALMHRMAERGRYPSMKFPAPKAMRPTPGVDVEAARAAFRAAAERVKALTGETVVWPPLGRMPTADFVAVQLLHGAHHLGYLRPTNH